MGFLPKDYEEPSESSYLNQLEEGKTRLRILGSIEDGSALVALEYWKTVDGQRKPFRVRLNVQVPEKELEADKWGNINKPSVVWLVPVYNHQTKTIQIWSVRQSSIRDGIIDLNDNVEDFGDPREYDIVVTKKGEGKESKYSVQGTPKKEVPDDILSRYKALNLNMNALYTTKDKDGNYVFGNPFSQDQGLVVEELSEDELDKADKEIEKKGNEDKAPSASAEEDQDDLPF